MKHGAQPTDEQLIAAARAVREHAYAPLTGVKVGAALATADGTIVTGCNVESPSAIFNLCAERTAVVKALADGHCKFMRIAVIGDFTSPISPCGFCRQVLHEFAPDLTVVMATVAGQTRTVRLADLIPLAYRIQDRED